MSVFFEGCPELHVRKYFCPACEGQLQGVCCLACHEGDSSSCSSSDLRDVEALDLSDVEAFDSDADSAGVSMIVHVGLVQSALGKTS